MTENPLFLKQHILSIKGLGRRPITAPPTSVVSVRAFRSADQIIGTNYGYHYPIAEVVWADNGLNQIIEIDAIELLHPSIRSIYGYADYDLGLRLNCHTATILFNKPHLIEKLSNDQEQVFEHFAQNYNQIPLYTAWKFGDITQWITRFRTDSGKWFIYGHSAVYIAPGLLFNRPGSGPTAPFYLQDTHVVSQITSAYTVSGKSIEQRHLRLK